MDEIKAPLFTMACLIVTNLLAIATILKRQSNNGA
jgi:hypothetical protein